MHIFPLREKKIRCGQEYLLSSNKAYDLLFIHIYHYDISVMYVVMQSYSWISDENKSDSGIYLT